ncbi:MAG: ABC transporter permease [Chlamydiales bacterium]
MRFELSVALKYLIPRWRQLSVSVISLVSIFVVSLVVWLAIVFLSVAEGIQERWIEGFVTLNPPVKITPTEKYFNSYYHQVDSFSLQSNFTPKSIREKRVSHLTDPYDPHVDRELPPSLSSPDLGPDGKVKDLVKEAWSSVEELNYKGIRPQEAEISLCNLRIRVASQGDEHAFLSQLSYVMGHDENNSRMTKLLLPPDEKDISYFFNAITGPKNFREFFDSVDVQKVATTNFEFILLPNLYPQEGILKGCLIHFPVGGDKVIVPSSLERLAGLRTELAKAGFDTQEVSLAFHDRKLENPYDQITVDRGVEWSSSLVEESLSHATSANSIRMQLKTELQGITISGIAPFNHLSVQKADLRDGASFWVYEKQDKKGCCIPNEKGLGGGVLISSMYRDKGVRLGDRGYLTFLTSTSTSVSEQQTPIYVAGFFDPGIIPMSGKLVLVSADMMRTFSGNLSLPDQTFANGINVWLDRADDAESVKANLLAAFAKRGIADYWNVETFRDYEFARPVLHQFDSDKTIFTLVSVMILIVACSNIISMLILLVNDKKKEIGILQSLGATPRKIAAIFGICGLATGLLSSLIGTILAILTLKNIQVLVQALNFLKGREFFQKMFFGPELPNKVSVSALLFVLLATIIISLFAGLVPAIKAARIRPSDTLRRDG